MCFGGDSKWLNVNQDANGSGLYGRMCHEARNPGKEKVSL